MWVPNCAPRTPQPARWPRRLPYVGWAQGGSSDYDCPTSVSATYLFVAHGLASVDAFGVGQRLLCELLTNPEGIDATAPRLS